METQKIATRLVELCRTGQFERAYDELFADDAVNIEMPEMATGPLGDAKGLEAMRRKSAAWSAGVEQMHGMTVSDPLVAGNWFCVAMSLDVTFKERGRMAMEELCIYHVRNGRIVREQFFYDAG
jgi:hypothetical protein